MSNLCDFSSSMYVVRKRQKVKCIIMYMCVATLLGVYVCAHAFLHHLKLVRCLVLVQTKNKPTTSSVQNKVSIAYIIHCG